MERWIEEELISQSRKQEQEYKEESKGSISRFERKNKIFKNRPLEFDQLVKLSKR